MQMLGGKPGGGSAVPFNPPAQQQQRQAPVQQNAPAPAAAAPIDDGFDDIPF
jgi:single-stranded DNA-binding protein